MPGFAPSVVFKNCVKPFGVLLRVWTLALCIVLYSWSWKKPQLKQPAVTNHQYT